MSELEPFIDLDNLFDYVIAEVFLDNRDWPLNNEQSWRPRTPSGRWRWIPYDLDGILGTSGRRPWVNTLRGKILYFPAKQPMHLLEPAAVWYIPLAHCLHVFEACVAENNLCRPEKGANTPDFWF